MFSKADRIMRKAKAALAEAEVNGVSTIIRHRKMLARKPDIVVGPCFTAYHVGKTSIYVGHNIVFNSASNIRDAFGLEYVGHRP